MPLDQRDAFSADIKLVQDAVRSGVTAKRISAHDNHWIRWLDFCFQHTIDPQLSQYDDPIPILQIFTQRCRDGRIAPYGHIVKARTAEDALRAVGQKFASMGTRDPRIDSRGKMDFQITRQLASYKKSDTPPKRVKPIPISLILHILPLGHTLHITEASRNIADIITMAFYFLLRPGEHTGTTKDDHLFLINDVILHLGTKPSMHTLHHYTKSKPLHPSALHSHDKKMGSVMRFLVMDDQATHCAAQSEQRSGYYCTTDSTELPPPNQSHPTTMCGTNSHR